MSNGREILGLPDKKSVEDWLNPATEAEYPENEEECEIKVDHENIPRLERYDTDPGAEFWSKFPRKNLPVKAETRVNKNFFEKTIRNMKQKMSKCEIKRAEKILRDLEEGAEAYQRVPELPPITVLNADSAMKYGYFLTDKIATWIEKGFVAGPFDCPPTPGFRANQLAVVERNSKIRPILNMSSPKNASFNDNVDKRRLEKVHMATPRSFSYKLREAGREAEFSKFDIKDAYKLVPAKPKDYRLQGFIWMNKYFCETRETFGSVASVCNFDRLSNTRDLVVCLKSGTPRTNICRVLDDTVCVAAAGTGITKAFTEEMKKTSSFLNIPLADNCSKNEKAFECQKKGTVLGIIFDSTKMSWSLPKCKADKVVRRCLQAKNAIHMDLKQTQELMGSVNDLAQMSPIMRFHKGTGNMFLAKFQGNENILLQVPADMKSDMGIIAKIAEKAKEGLPIAAEQGKPPLSTLVFYTDAAGASYTMVNGKMVFHNQADRGVSCIGGESIQDIWIWSRLKWPEALLIEQKDEKGTRYGNKSTTLECIGLLIPFLAFPNEVRGRHILFKVDNAAVTTGWERGYVKNDKAASKIIKCIGYIAALLGTRVYVEHVDRMSDEMASLADELSRKCTAKDKIAQKALNRAEKREVKGFFLEWLRNPEGNQDLCWELVTDPAIEHLM